MFEELPNSSFNLYRIIMVVRVGKNITIDFENFSEMIKFYDKWISDGRLYRIIMLKLGGLVTLYRSDYN